MMFSKKENLKGFLKVTNNEIYIENVSDLSLDTLKLCMRYKAIYAVTRYTKEEIEIIFETNPSLKDIQKISIINCDIIDLNEDSFIDYPNLSELNIINCGINKISIKLPKSTILLNLSENNLNYIDLINGKVESLILDNNNGIGYKSLRTRYNCNIL